jgi:hypothetical protein
LLNLLDNFTWLCIITEGKYNKYDKMLAALEEKSKRFPLVDRKHEFESIVLRNERKLSIDKTIALIRNTIDTVKLNSLIEDFNISLRANPKRITEFGNHVKENKNHKKLFGEVFTPTKLIQQMLDKFPPDVWTNPNLSWLDPACGTVNFLLCIKERLMEGLKLAIPDAAEREKHIITKMLWGVDIQPRNCVLGAIRLCYDGKHEVNIVCANSLTFDFWNKRFDIIVGNPPYQSQSGNKGAGNILWDKFVRLVNGILSDGGYVCLVHPSLWREPNHKLRKIIGVPLYLEIHGEIDGLNTFGAETRYDWYVTKKGYSGKTEIKDQSGKMHVLDLSKLSFIPNADFELCEKLLSQSEEDKIEIINDRSAYGADKNWLSKNKSNEFQYPCVYMVRKTEELILRWASKNTNGHFGVPKIIYGRGRPISVGFYPDRTGEYGLTQWASGIVAPVDELETIATVLRSAKFRAFCLSISMSKLEINTSILRLFRKDFWKEFQ